MSDMINITPPQQPLSIELGNQRLDIVVGNDDYPRANLSLKIFKAKFPDPHRRALVIVHNTAFNARVGMKLASVAGIFDNGNWDTFNMDGSNQSVSKQLEIKKNNEDPVPVRYVVGFSDKIPLEAVEEFKSYIKDIKKTHNTR